MCIAAQEVPEGALCTVCFCDYDDVQDEPCTWPGCRAVPPHPFDSQKDYRDPSGVALGKGFAHRSCVKKPKFCATSAESPPPPLCPACQWDDEAVQWRGEFSEATAMISDALARSSGTLDAPAVEELFRQMVQRAEIAPVSNDSPAGVAELANLLQDAIERLHPQPAIRAVGREVCQQLVAEKAGAAIAAAEVATELRPSVRSRA
eukprot:CAMPEP_0115584910 /NCGR_PEP_ID=MMETSP0272-20121206/6927_1 /TAXON_ID=71861 /ORGANISM="Scrippsiella trochoidea, Strain CCMP3099" /LENGTH=204 /DNA_ID=CAMNT_0003019959 /DNA_START=51 /DNA_END=664 /DNA_ORIENTATION=-